MNINSQSIAVVMLLGDCDMKCAFCITDKAVETMSKEDYAGTLTHLKAKGFSNIVIGGGEPFCWPEGVAGAAKLARDNEFYVQVGTNGILMPDSGIVHDFVDRYVIPLDSADAALHNGMRHVFNKQLDHHALILGRLEQLKRRGHSVTVSTVVSRANINRLLEVGDLLADYVADGGCLHAWHLYCFVPRGRGGSKTAGTLGITRDEFDGAVEQAKTQHYPYTIFKRPDMRHSRMVDFFWKQDGRLQVGSEVWKDEEPVGSFFASGCDSSPFGE